MFYNLYYKLRYALAFYIIYECNKKIWLSGKYGILLQNFTLLLAFLSNCLLNIHAISHWQLLLLHLFNVDTPFEEKSNFKEEHFYKSVQIISLKQVTCLLPHTDEPSL